METKKILNRILVGIALIMVLAYHISTIAYIGVRTDNNHYVLLNIEVNPYILMDLCLFILLGILLILLVIIE